MTRSVLIRRAAAIWMFCVVLAAWAFLVATLVLDMEKNWRIAAAFAAAISTEAFMWIGAGLLGWKMFESRKAIWRRLSGAGTA